MRILSRYLFREIINFFLIFLAITIVILLVAQFYDSRSAFLQNHPPLGVYLLYVVLTLPGELSEVLPLIALISTMFSYGVLAKNKEILAMVAAGISFKRLAMPAVLFGIGITALFYAFSEFVVPRASYRAEMMEHIELKDRDPASLSRRRDVFIKAGANTFIAVNTYQGTQREMIYPSLFEMNPDGTGISERVEANRAILVSHGEENSNWRFEGVERWQFNADGTLRHYEKVAAPLDMQLGPELDRFLARTKDPLQMDYLELRNYVQLLEKQGGERMSVYKTSLQQKLAFPLACLLLALLGYAVVADVHARHFASGVFLGLVITVIFYITYATSSNLSKSGAIGAVTACWLPLVAFLILNAVLMARLNRVRG